jgi:hypothetical protein
VRLNQKKYGVVAVHFFDLEAAGLADGDLVTLDIGGAQVGGMVWTDKGGPWLSKGPTDWSSRRRTDALLAVGITHPHRADAVLTSIDVVADPTADHEELHARASRLMQLPIRGSEAIGNAVPSRVEVRMMRFERDPRVVAAARRRADGRCESCGRAAPSGPLTPQRPDHCAATYSRLSFVIAWMLISLGQTAEHSYWLEQAPKPSWSICSTIARTRRSRSAWPWGSRSRWATLAPTKSIAAGVLALRDAGAAADAGGVVHRLVGLGLGDRDLVGVGRVSRC